MIKNLMQGGITFNQTKLSAFGAAAACLFATQAFVGSAYEGDTMPNTVDDGQLLPEEAVAAPWENDFSELVDQAINKYPDRYSEAGISTDRSSAWIFFKGEAPADIVTASRLLPIAVEVKGSAKSSQDEIQAVQAEIYQKAQKVMGKDIVSDASAVDGTITISYDKDTTSAKSADSLRDFSKSLLASERSAQPQFKVNVVAEKNVSSNPEALYGGGYLTRFFCRDRGVL